MNTQDGYELAIAMYREAEGLGDACFIEAELRTPGMPQINLVLDVGRVDGL
jgi:hypothetical protein